MELDDLDPDPIVAFASWYDPADAAMCLATARRDGTPDARMVLLKEVDDRGFVFYTNEQSAKGAQLLANPRAALVFHWTPRQVRVRGRVERVTDAESDAYWATRARASQLGAWASAQSAEIASRDDLEAELARVDAAFAGRDVPRPPHWRGFRVIPDEIEFWMHRDDRLHDRILYRREGSQWPRARLSP